MIEPIQFFKTAALVWLASGFSPAVLAGDSYLDRLESWLAQQGYGDGLLIRQVVVFGDGDPANGVEDNRIGFSSPGWNQAELEPLNKSAGTIQCDGKVRGSATILDVSEFHAAPHGMILATAAHVLLDLDTGNPFRNCNFHYLGLTGRRDRGRIDLEQSVQGNFDFHRPRNSPEFGRQDWAFLHVPENIPAAAQSGGIRPRAFSVMADKAGARYGLIGFSLAHGEVGISLDCQVRESVPGDIGGGSWPGQLLDDCDSTEGASGGGLIAWIADEQFIVGVRNGSHWDDDVFPVGEYPGGPPAGSLWNVHTSTNFSRAIDAGMLLALRKFLAEIEHNARRNHVD